MQNLKFSVMMKKIYFLFGDDDFLILDRVKEITSQLNTVQSNSLKIEKLELHNIENIDSLYAQGSNMSLFPENLVLIIEINTKLFKHIDKEYTDFVNLISSISVYKTVLLVFSLEKFDKALIKLIKESGFYKKLSTIAVVQEFFKLKYWQVSEIKERVKLLAKNNDIQFEENALSLFVECFKEQLEYVSSELQKLKTCILPQKLVTVRLVEELYFNGFNIDDLYSFILYSKQDSVFSLSDQLLKLKSPIYLIASLQNKFRQALQIKSLLELNTPVYQISKTTGINSYKIEKLKSELKNISLKRIQNILEVLSDIEFKTKIGVVAPQNAMDMILVNTL